MCEGESPQIKTPTYSTPSSTRVVINNSHFITHECTRYTQEYTRYTKDIHTPLSKILKKKFLTLRMRKKKKHIYRISLPITLQLLQVLLGNRRPTLATSLATFPGRPLHPSLHLPALARVLVLLGRKTTLHHLALLQPTTLLLVVLIRHRYMTLQVLQE